MLKSDIDLAMAKTVLPAGSIDLLQQEVVNWADKQFPNREWINTFNKLRYEEIFELFESPKNPDEYADIFILLLDLANMVGLNGDKLATAIRDKLNENKRRVWKIDPTTGIARHTEELP